MTAQHGKRSTSTEVVVLFTIVAVFAVAAFWIVGRIQSDYEQFPPYSTFSTQPDGARGLWLLSQELGLEVSQYIGSGYDYPQQSAMVMLHEEGMDTAAMLFNKFNFDVVIDWVEQGNCLIVATPPQSMLAYEITEELGTEGYATYTVDPRVSCTYLQGGQPGKATAFQRVYQPGQQYELPADPPPLWQGLQSFESAGASGAPYLADAGVLLSTSTPPEPVILHFNRGQGEVFWLLRPEIASNRWLDCVGNAQLMWALLSYTAQYGTVYFDESIHGYQQPHKSTLQLIFTTPGGWLLLAGLFCVLLLMMNRAIPPARFVVHPVAPRRDSTEMVLAQADLFRRARVTGLAGHSLADSYRRALHGLLKDGSVIDEETFRQVLGRLIARSVGRYPLANRYVETGIVSRNLSELVAFAQELSSLTRLASQSPDWTHDQRRVQ